MFRNTLDEADRTVIIMPGEKAEDFKVDHRWDANHLGVVLSSMQRPGLAIQDVRHKPLGVGGQVRKQGMCEIPNLVTDK